MASNNAKLEKIGAYTPNTSSVLTAPTIVQGDLSGVSFTDGLNEFVGKRWGAVTPKVQVALIGINSKGAPKCTEFSAEVAPAGALTANQALQVVIPKEEIPAGTLGFLVAANNGSGSKKIIKQALNPAIYTRFNIAPDDDVTLTCPLAPEGGYDTTAIDALLASDTADVYGGTYFDFGVQLGTGRGEDHGISSFEAEANNAIYTFASAASYKARFNINAMNTLAFRRFLALIGYVSTGDETHYGTVGGLETIVIDMDCSPFHETGSKVERNLIWTASTRSLEAVNVADNYKSKEGQDVVVSAFPSDYLPFGQVTKAFETAA